VSNYATQAGTGAQGRTQQRSVQRRQGRPWRRLQARVIRENSICWLCGAVVDKAIKWPDPLSPSVDHLVPLSMGGSLTDPRNVRLAHLRCNSSKGNGRRGKSAPDPLPTSRRW
jgi:5-methylcytosine-specific restriction endonuclease McrA